jgi:hypothetical protein
MSALPTRWSPPILCQRFRILRGPTVMLTVSQKERLLPARKLASKMPLTCEMCNSPGGQLREEKSTMICHVDSTFWDALSSSSTVYPEGYVDRARLEGIGPNGPEMLETSQLHIWIRSSSRLKQRCLVCVDAKPRCSTCCCAYYRFAALAGHLQKGCNLNVFMF